ncbi:MAG TPA: hypothetical protein VMW78_00995 [Anaerolineae bacterium]|nr:hypothetical protein [Anaerolineae bacterium]
MDPQILSEYFKIWQKGSAIYSVEHGVFAGEFIEDMAFKVISRWCSGDRTCLFALKKGLGIQAQACEYLY